MQSKLTPQCKIQHHRRLTGRVCCSFQAAGDSLAVVCLGTVQCSYASFDKPNLTFCMETGTTLANILMLRPSQRLPMLWEQRFAPGI